MTNKIAIGREQEIFLVKETTKGTLVPPAASNYVIAAGMGSINQQPSFTDSPEVKSSRGIMDRFRDRTPAGTWSFPTLVRPSGSLGTAPQEDTLWECHLGTKTENASTSVVYTPAKEKPSFSLWFKKDHTVFNASGGSVGAVKASLQTKGGMQLDWNGKFMQLGWAGTGTVDATEPITETEILTDDARKFTVGSLVEFELADGTVYNNSDAGYEVTARNVSTNVVTITDGASGGLEAEIASGSTIRGWLPTGTKVGVPLESRKGYAQIDGSSIPVRSMDLTINDDPSYLEDEITTSGYPEEYAEGQRSLDGNISVYFREDDVSYWYDGMESDEKALKMICGDTAGDIIELSMAKTIFNVPSMAEADPTVALDMPYKALETSGDDEITVTYK